jgi:hypothetical protein
VLKRAVLTFGVLLMASPAWAAPLTMSSFGGSWSNATTGSGGCVQINNDSSPISDPDDVRWRGRGLLLGFIPTCSSLVISYSNGNTSGYVFDPTNNSYTFPGSPSPFALGTFTHRNNPISGSITSIDYDLTFNHNDPSPPPNPFTLHFDFTHNETPNPAGDNAVTTILPLTQSFFVGSNQYLFTVLGFAASSGGPYLFSFSTPESSSQTMTLWASVDEVVAVSTPEPASLVLTGMGLLAAAARLRKRRQSRGTEAA